MSADNLKKLAQEAALVAGLPSPSQAKELVAKTAKELAVNADLSAFASPESIALVRGIVGTVQALLQNNKELQAFIANAKQSPAAAAAQVAISVQPFVLSAIDQTVAADKYMTDKAKLAAGFATAIYASALSFGQGVIAERDAVTASKLQAAADEADACYGGKALYVFLNPRGTGKGGALVPADVFAFSSFPEWEGACNMAAEKKAPLFRPALGAGLIRLLESGLDEGATPTATYALPPDEIAFAKTHPNNAVLGSAGVIPGNTIPARYYDLWLKKMRSILGPKVGIPLERRLLFRALRLTIQAQYGVKGSDGGASLWPLYMDLLADTFSKGYIPGNPNGLDQMFFNRVLTPDKGNPDAKVVGVKTELVNVPDPNSAQGWKSVEKSQWEIWKHPYPVSTLIYDMARNWNATINPTYASDISDREKTAKKFEQLSKVAALTSIGGLVDKKLLEGLDPAEVNAATGGKPLKLRPSFGGLEDEIARAQGRGGSPLLGIAVYAGIGVVLGLGILKLQGGQR